MASDLEQTDAEDGEAKKSSKRILQHELAEAEHALERESLPLFISGFAAGLELGFSLLLMGVVLTEAEGILAKPILEMFTATMYSFGFVIVVIGRSELFTEQTSLAVLPLLSGQTTFRKVSRLWGTVFLANLLGGAVISFFIVTIGPALGVVDNVVFGGIAKKLVEHSWWVILLSGVLAGWLMGLLSWLVAAGRDTISQIVIVWLITTAIGFGPHRPRDDRSPGRHLLSQRHDVRRIRTLLALDNDRQHDRRIIFRGIIEIGNCPPTSRRMGVSATYLRNIERMVWENVGGRKPKFTGFAALPQAAMLNV